LLGISSGLKRVIYGKLGINGSGGNAAVVDTGIAPLMYTLIQRIST